MTGETDFAAALLDPETAQPEGLTDGAGRAAGRRFDVYRNNVTVSLIEALETAFPVIRKLLGENNFSLLAKAFLRAHPPSSPLMMFYGADMPGFLATFEPTSQMGYLPDVARLELLLRESYHAADAEAVRASDLAAMAPDALIAARMRLAPSVRLLRSDWPIHAIWRFNSEEGAPKPVMQAEDVLVLRPEFDPAPHLLPAGGGVILAGLLDGRTLGEALENAPDADLPALLSLLLSHGAIIEVTP